MVVPIVIPHMYNGRNPSFFFAGFEDQKEYDNVSELGSVPLPASPTGDFSRLPPLPNGDPGVIYDPTTAWLGSDGCYHRKPFPGNIVPAVAGSDCLYYGHRMGQMVFTGTPESPYGRHQGSTQWKDLGPRFGFAWSVDDKTAVRGGYAFQPLGMRAVRTAGGGGTDGFSSETYFDFTFNNQQTIAKTIDNPTPSGYSLSQGSAAGPNTFSGLSIQNTFFDTYRNPYSIEGNRTIQRSLPEQAVVEVARLYNRALLLAGITTVSFLVKMTQPAKDLRSRIADRNNSIWCFNL